jgi:transcriptional regulator with XRE-family HTH domain
MQVIDVLYLKITFLNFMLYKILVTRRFELGLSQESIAQKAGVLSSTVSKWENNKIKGVIPITTIHKMSIGYGIAKSKLISAIPDKQKSNLIKSMETL